MQFLCGADPSAANRRSPVLTRPDRKEARMAEASGRPLPLLTLDNEFFWTSGEDGTLRIQECNSCAALIHPPQPVCRYCRGHDLGVREVSGLGTLASFTV